MKIRIGDARLPHEDEAMRANFDARLAGQQRSDEQKVKSPTLTCTLWTDRELRGRIGERNMRAEFHRRFAPALEMQKALRALTVKAVTPCDVGRNLPVAPVVFDAAVGENVGHGSVQIGRTIQRCIDATARD